jgi:hypothetical protein
LTSQPPCWHFEYEHVSGSLCLHKAIICLPIEYTNRFIYKVTKECYKLEDKNEELSGNIIYQRIESYQIPIPNSDMTTSANEIEIRIFEDWGLEYKQEKIEKILFETEEVKCLN